jgi:ADP-ribose pyrophosphatase YjhB (NUDIX family)
VGLQYHPRMTDEISTSASSAAATSVPGRAPPIHKVGVVVLRQDADALRVLLMRPKAKRFGDKAPWVLPRGTRQYFDPATKQWCDARTAEDAAAHARDEWESFARAAIREVHEEAGVPQSLLDARGLETLGGRDYHAPKGAVYPIYWFRLALTPEDMARLEKPGDAEEVGWFTLKEMQEEAAHGAARAGYVAVVKEAMGGQWPVVGGQRREPD